MRVAIFALGTRGDVEPFISLAIALKSLGHEPLLAAPSQFEAVVRYQSIAFAHLPGDYLDLLQTKEVKAVLSEGQGFSSGLKLLKQFKPIVRRQLTAEWLAAKNFQPELLIYHPKCIGALHVSQRLSCPAVLASPIPGFTPTKVFASPLVPFSSLGGLLNRLSHVAMAHSSDVIFGPMIREWRVSELHLLSRPTRSLHPRATIYAFSPTILPRPNDWPANADVTGYWFLPNSDWRPDRELQSFLEAGDAPVYVGFGSMPSLNPTVLTKTIVEALALAGKRGVLATGGGAILSDGGRSHVHFIDGAPHRELFPLMSACVHHGGAGTTGASLRAGKPTIICPFFGDQRFWAGLVERLGLGPPRINKKQLNAQALAAAISEATSNRLMQDKAAQVGASIRAERGVQTAMGFLERAGLLTPTLLPSIATNA